MNDLKELLTLGVQSKRDGHYSLALDYYNRALEIDEFNPEIHNAIGKVKFINKDFQDALSAFRTAALYSSNFLNFDVFSDTSDNFEVKLAKQQVQYQIDSLLLTFGKHCGFSILSLHIENYKSDEAVVAALDRYRSQIDPFYSRKSFNVKEDILNQIEERATIVGIEDLNRLSENSIFHKLNVISNHFLTSNKNNP